MINMKVDPLRLMINMKVDPLRLMINMKVDPYLSQPLEDQFSYLS
jgi:hypothetical protein